VQHIVASNADGTTRPQQVKLIYNSERQYRSRTTFPGIVKH